MSEIFSFSNLLIFSVLIGLNCAFILPSNRKRKFGLYSPWIFLFFFIAFIGGVMYSLIYEKQDKKHLPTEVLIQREFTNKKYKAGAKVKLFLHDPEQKNIKVEAFREYTLRASTIQAFLTLLLSFWGLISVRNRNPFYIRVIVYSVIAIILCIVTENYI